VAFDPSGRHLLVSSQRGLGGAGATYEISGPFREGRPRARPTSTLAEVAAGDGDDGSELAVPLTVAGVGVGAAAAGALVWRARRSSAPAPPAS
jgi:hypothetical protein